MAKLGEDGMGEVYRSRDTRLGRDVAVKVLPGGSVGDAQSESRFDREARAIAALNHPNICALYDVGRHDGRSFLVMELLEGETLHTRLARGPFAVADIVDHAIALADVLDNAHAHGVPHRDLKPANIFVTKRGPAKIAAPDQGTEVGLRARTIVKRTSRAVPDAPRPPAAGCGDRPSRFVRRATRDIARSCAIAASTSASGFSPCSIVRVNASSRAKPCSFSVRPSLGRVQRAP